jgi:hypothetical protein
MTWNELLTTPGRLAFHRAKVRVACAASSNTQETLIRHRSPLQHVGNLQRTVRNNLRSLQGRSSHSHALKTLPAFLEGPSMLRITHLFSPSTM